jgi:hypothetical protein
MVFIQKKMRRQTTIRFVITHTINTNQIYKSKPKRKPATNINHPREKGKNTFFQKYIFFDKLCLNMFDILLNFN